MTVRDTAGQLTPAHVWPEGRALKLTKDNLPAIREAFAASPLTDKIYFDEDLPGFGLRLRKGSNREVWICRYEYAGIQRKLTLGTVAVLRPDQAREKARRAMAEIVLGGDPQARKAEERARARLTLRYVANQYLQRQENQLRPRSLREAKRYLLKSFRPLHHMPIHKITRRDIAIVLNDLSVKTPVAAARGRATLSAMFSWSKGEGYLDGDNPVEGTNNPAPIVARDRVLSDAELASIWNNCGDDAYGYIVKLLILTGARREEVGGMVWDELKNGIWTIPKNRTKNKREHALALPRLAWSIIEKIPRGKFNDPLFGGFNDWHRAKGALDKRCQIVGPEQKNAWRLHDLRRTFRTGLGRLGVAPHIAELCMNHRKSGVEATYDRYSYEREINAALAVWADHVASIVSGEERKIMQFPPRAG